MNTQRQPGPDRRAGPPPADGRRLTPVLARALELGRGPPRLVSWLAEHRSEPLARLSAELNQRIREAGVTETLAE